MGRQNRRRHCAGRDPGRLDGELLLCRDCLDPGAQACFIAAGSVLVQDALLHALVDDGNGRTIGGLGGGFVALFNGLAQRAQCAPQP